MAKETRDSLRIDRWLWYTRFYKTRSLATSAVSGGHIRINGERVKPGRYVAHGDIIDLVRNQLAYRLTVLAIPDRRGPAAEARLCYSESEDDILARERVQAELRRDRLQMPRTPGKPDKHTRRQLLRRNRQGSDEST